MVDVIGDLWRQCTERSLDDAARWMTVSKPVRVARPLRPAGPPGYPASIVRSRPEHAVGEEAASPDRVTSCPAACRIGT